MKKIVKMTNQKKFIITKKGSLGLLAYGDIGFKAWRKVKKINK